MFTIFRVYITTTALISLFKERCAAGGTVSSRYSPSKLVFLPERIETTILKGLLYSYRVHDDLYAALPSRSL